MFKVVVVSILAPLPKPLNYLVDKVHADVLLVGRRVRVPLGRRFAVGVVLEAIDVEDGTKLKPIAEVLDDEPLLQPELLTFVRRASAYYAFPLGLALKAALPAGLGSLTAAPKVKHVRVYSRTDMQLTLRGSLQKEILAWIENHGPIDLDTLRQQFPSPYTVLQRLEALELITCRQKESQRDPFVGIDVVADQDWPLNDEQAIAVSQIAAASVAEKFKPFLLHGVTGSGKTEVYLQAIRGVLSAKKQALVLVPEIALTPQLVGRFRARFEQESVRVGVLHSGMSTAERFDMWRAVVRDEVDIVIGARSAIFAPLSRLGIIVVDEEHDDSYKQSEGFRYQGRDLALMRGQMEGVAVVLGSATPSLGSWQRAEDQLLQRLSLTKRVGERPLPEVTLVDMKNAEVEGGLSAELRDAITQTLEREQQCLLLLNRRGYAPFLLCGDCGASYRCPNCEITLTWHRKLGQLRCHYCDYHQPPADECPQCGGAAMDPEGMGTERLADELQLLYPDARIERMDRDTTAAKNAQQAIVGRMERRGVDILVGTQMIAKGHDFAAVTLVGVVDTDAALNFPDFRSAERSFSLLAQVAGRAGRADLPGRVVVQTYSIDNPVLQCAIDHDYLRFAKQELPLRQLLSYPPFGCLANLVLSGLDRQEVERAADALVAGLESQAEVCSGVEVLGPAPCPLFRLRNRYRMQILLKGQSRRALRELIAYAPQWNTYLSARLTLVLDIDPVDMM